jgi:glucosylceramidase
MLKKERRVFSIAAIGLVAFLGTCDAGSRPPSKSDYQQNYISTNGQNLLGNTHYPAICYSGHRETERTVENTPSIEETKEDLKILAAMGVKILRTYNTQQFPHSERILQSISELKTADPDFAMFVMLGVWIQCKGAYTDTPDHRIEDAEWNQKEIEAAIRLADEYPDIVKIIAVGNEAMVTWQEHFVPAKTVLKWVKVLSEARADGRIPERTLLTTSDNWAALGGEESYRNEDLAELMRQMDYISLHTYAFHDTYYNPELPWGPLPDEAGLSAAEQIENAVTRSVNYQKKQVQAVKDYLKEINIDKEIHIGETGWASLDDSYYGDDGTCAAHEYTAGLFYKAVREWTKNENMTCFYFEAFDEPWKSKGPSGSEAHFGLFTVNGRAKYALWNQLDAGAFDGLSRNGNPIVKTFNGNETALTETLKAPAPSQRNPSIKIYQTSRQGERLAPVGISKATGKTPDYTLTLNRSKTYQTLVGIGGSFTESGASVLAELSVEARRNVMNAYFSPEGAHISLTRTHIASCDFSLRNYTYAPVPGDVELKHFSIKPDRAYLLPMIKAAQAVDGADFKILASPWTAPPWMKTNNDWNGGELKPEHYSTFAAYIVKYIQAYEKEGVPIWGLTPVNEPLGNDANWESLHFNPKQMRKFIADHLGPALTEAGLDVPLWIYDQNREEIMLDWADTIYGNEKAAAFVRGMAVHWYQSTVDVGGELLDKVHQKYSGKEILHSEGCVDALGDDEPIGSWLEDDWYWRAEATDWGKFWAAEEEKKNHPPYRPFYRYTRDLIGGLNHHFVGWIDWNMVLNTRGGPNHARNYCLAPILVDSGRDQVYFTPLYYSIAHVSKFIRPGAQRIDLTGHNETFMATAFKNPDDSIAVVVFNLTEKDVFYSVNLDDRSIPIQIKGQALQTVIIR